MSNTSEASPVIFALSTQPNVVFDVVCTGTASVNITVAGGSASSAFVYKNASLQGTITAGNTQTVSFAVTSGDTVTVQTASGVYVSPSDITGTVEFIAPATPTPTESATPTATPSATGGPAPTATPAPTGAGGSLFVAGYAGYGQIDLDLDSGYVSLLTQSGIDTTWQKVAGGYIHYMYAQKNDGTWWFTGYNAEGMSGTSDVTNRSSLIQFSTDTDWVDIYPDYKATFGKKSDGSLWSWGSGNTGDNAQISGLDYSSPVQCIAGPVNWVSTYLGGLAVLSDNNVYAWGSNTAYRFTDIIAPAGLGDYLSSPTMILGGGVWAKASVDNAHSAFLRTDGTLWTLGFNGSGQLGQDNTDSTSSPVQVGTDTTWTEVYTGYECTFGLKSDNTLWAWGYNYEGQFGNLESGNAYSSPIQVLGGINWQFVNVGHKFVTGIDNAGQLWRWGYNSYYNLADGTTDPMSSPVQVSIPAANWLSVASGYGFVFGVGDTNVPTPTPTATNSPTPSPSSTGPTPTPSSTPAPTPQPGLPSILYAWGQNLYGELGVDTTVNVSSPLQVGTSADWVYANGAIKYDVAGGIKSDGTLWLWGQNENGYLGVGTGDFSSPTQILGGGTNWYNFAYGKGGGGIGGFGLGVKNDGSLWIWGKNFSGNLGNDTTVSTTSPENSNTGNDWNRVCTGEDFSCGIKVDDTLWVWGNNGAGQLGLNDTIDRSSPVQVGGYWLTASTGYRFMGGIKKDSSLWMWGNNNQGQLGNEDPYSISSPIQIGTDTNWQFLSCGETHTAAIKTDGSLWLWGNNPTGELADNTSENRSSPVQVYGGGVWLSVSCTQDGTAAIKNDGKVYCWGSNSFGSCGIDSTTDLNISSPVQALLQGNWSSVARSQFAFFAIGAGAMPTPTATESPTPTPTPSDTPSPSPSDTPVPTGTPAPTGLPTSTATPSPTVSANPTATPSPTPSESPSPTPSDTPIPTNLPSQSPTATAIPTPTETPSPTVSANPTATPSPTPSESPSPTPSDTPIPTNLPSQSPTATAAATPTETPSPTPSDSPSPTPSPSPSESPTPTPTPSDSPSPTPSESPTPTPSDSPSPTPSPSPSPSNSPSPTPSPTPAVISITPTTLNPTTQGVAVNEPLTALGGTGTYSWSISAGSLPAGVTINPTSGLISGTPTNNGTFNFTVDVTDNNAPPGFGQQPYSWVINPPVSLSPSSLSPMVVGASFSESLSASGGTSPYSYAVTAGTLPAGLVLNPLTGVITGTPTTSGAYSFTITATDSVGATASQPYTGTVTLPTVIVLPATLNTIQVSVPFSESVSASGGTAPYTYAVTAGTLPAGLTLNPTTGLISGTPTVSGPYGFTITANDSFGTTGSQAYSGIVAGPNIDVVTQTNFVTTPVIVPGAGFGFTNVGTGSGNLYLQFVQSNPNPQSVEVTTNNSSNNVILVNVNSITYQVNPGENFDRTFVIPFMGLMTISSVVTALYPAASVSGTVYIAGSENCLYRLHLTPTVRAVEGDEGSLDTSVINGRSMQRTGYLTITENVTQVKVMEVADGGCINTQIQQLPDVIPLVTDGYPQG